MKPSKGVLIVAAIALLSVTDNYVRAQNQFQTDILNDANSVITNIRQESLFGSYHHLNYILMNGNSISQRTELAKNNTRNYVDNIGLPYIAALNIDAYYNGGKIKPTVNVTDVVKRARELVYPKLPEFKREHEELVKLHDTLLHELNSLNGFSSANIATDCQNENNEQFQNCLGEKIVAYNATAFGFYKKVRDGAKLSIGYLKKVDKIYDDFVANRVKELTKDITLKLNQLAENIYVQGNTGKYILGFGKLHMQWTINSLVTSIEKLYAGVDSVFIRINGYFTSTPKAFSEGVFRLRLDKLNVTVHIRSIISKASSHEAAVQKNNSLNNIIDKSARFFVTTVKTYDDSLDVIHRNSLNNKTRAEEIKAQNNPSKFDKIDTAYFDCYNTSSPTPHENLMTCIHEKRYNVEEKLTKIKESLETQYQHILQLNAVPYLRLQDQFLSYAERELVTLLARIQRK